MADIRIKDLTTTASSTASDDFFAADGTTNGTRKLSAYSPSFGGNATVGGTLTVTGVATASSGLVIGSGSFAEGKLYYGAFGGLTIAAKTGSSYDLYIAAPDGNAIGYVPTGTKTLTLPSTTASTTTSSGALVVGNGTSGGLGVGGAINAGGTITSTNGSGSGLLGMRSSSGNASYVFWSETGVADRGILGFNNGSSTLSYRSFSSSFSTGTEVFSVTSGGNATVGGTLTAGDNVTIPNAKNFVVRNAAASSTAIRMYADSSDFGYIDCTANTELRLQVGSGTKLSITNTGNVSIPSSTASTSTSSGALVVSGGVGVAGAIYAGGIVRCGASNGFSLGADTGNIRIDTGGSAGVEFRGLNSADTVTGFTMREMALVDGTTAPSTRAGYATIYVDTADGDLKVKFGDGTVKTIATDS